jgi:DNA-binding response OmpR family regulator
MRLLIVEKEPALALAIEGIAIAEGFEIAGIATNTSEAIELRPEADAAIIDVRLGDGLTGPSIARALFAGFGLGVAYLCADPDIFEDAKGGAPISPERIRKALSLAAKSAREQMLQDRSGQTT